GFGHRGRDAVVVKVAKQPGDEWQSGSVLRAFDGNAAVRVLELADGATLLERATPGDSLAALVRAGRDTEATEIIGRVITSMSRARAVEGAPTVTDWFRG